MNPFIDAWLKPRQTARYMIKHKSNGYVLLLVTIGMIGSLLEGLRDTDVTLSPAWLFVTVLVSSPIVALMSNSLSAWIYWKVGDFFNGAATYNELFKGISISVVPYVTFIPLYTLWLTTAPESLISTTYVGPIPWYDLPVLIITCIAQVWSMCISIVTIAEVQQIRIWQAIVTVVIATFAYMIVIFPILFIMAVFLLSS